MKIQVGQVEAFGNPGSVPDFKREVSTVVLKEKKISSRSYKTFFSLFSDFMYVCNK
jgi:hypothetical protein